MGQAHRLGMSTNHYHLFDHLTLPCSPITLGLYAVSFLFLLLGFFLYAFQSKLIYMPQLPPGSLEQVWLPSRFGYGPGRTIKRNSRSLKSLKEQKDRDSEDEAVSVDSDEYNWEEVEIVTKDKVKLQAYWIKAPSKWNKGGEAEGARQRSNFNINKESDPYTVLYMQANAGNIGHRLPIARKLQETFDCNVLMLSYRGYGKSSGTPSESGIKIDSQAALDFVWNEKLKTDGERSKLIVYGQSIGGAVAIHLAHSNPSKVRFLIVENTFLSIPQLIPRVVPVLKPFAFLCNQRWNSHQLIPSLSQKILFLAGKSDELIPPDHMIKLHQLARKSVYKKLVQFEKGTHNDTCIQAGYFEAIEEFLRTTPKTPRVTVEEITDEDDYE